MVACIAENADFVFHLHHQDGVVAQIDFPDVAHHAPEGFAVSFDQCLAESTENLDSVTVSNGTGEAMWVASDPKRRITGHAVFPCSQPQEYNSHVVFSRLP